MLPPAACITGPMGLVPGREEKSWPHAPLCPRQPSTGSHGLRGLSKHGLESPRSKPCVCLSNRSVLHARNTSLMVEQKRRGVSCSHSRQGPLGLTFFGLCPSLKRLGLLAELLWPRLLPLDMSNRGSTGEAQAFRSRTVARLHGWSGQGSGTSAGSWIPPFHHGP